MLHRIHNAYLLASAWKIVSETLHELAQQGLTDKTIKMQLRSNENLRTRYLVLYDLVTVLVNLSQVKFSLLATTTRKFFCAAHVVDESFDLHLLR